ncbi:hypothetical protein PRIPAC_87689 [Pristionchus pacificus]|uniref:glucuronosyltransferase n=1 Tax=Pristionchus pacificus TaxID=54126 RepID=A0A2A6B6W2_PRIPA|nr:hypothetical protein PRIPAC_87689 [Pristionchus pacificus]|eukprot:PDM61604.1 ugt-20 [Pristionchus pacificus]
MRLLFLLVAVCTSIESYKILVYNSKYGHSHSNFLGNIADLLVDAGHDVTSLIPVIDESGKDGTEKSKKIYVPVAQETRDQITEIYSQRSDFFKLDNYNPVLTWRMRDSFARQFLYQCRAVLDDVDLLKRLQNESFDVMIVENFDMCGPAYSHLVKPKSLITSSASFPFSQMYAEFGIPISLSYNPSPYVSRLNVNSMWGRITNLYAEWLLNAFFHPCRWMIEELFYERFGPSFPSLEEISSHSAYTLLNSEPLIDYAVPTLSRVVNIGGIGARKPSPVNKEWDEILSRRSKTILLSFGSVAKSIYIPGDIKDSILKTIARFPDITFIWKYEQPEDEFAKEALRSLPNLHLSKWTPQNDILADDRLTAFITHGGMGSTQETATRGKPGIFIPLFGDQPRNAGMMQYNGFGVVLDKFDMINPDSFEGAIREVLNNESYRINARRISSMLAKKPFTSKELLIKTVEFAAEYGPSKALRPQSHDMTFIEYHNLDIVAVFAVFLILSLIATKKLCCFLISFCIGTKKVKSD